MADQELKKLVKHQPKKKRDEEEDYSLGGILEYLQEVSGRLDSTENVEDFKVLIENVLCELDGKEILVLSRNLTSRCFEKFIPFLNHQNLIQIFEKIEDKEILWKLSTNPYGSRVYQALLRHIQNDEIQGELFTQLEQHGFWIAEDICDYLTERNASYVFRDCLLFANGGMLAGKEKEQSERKSGRQGMGMHERLKKNKVDRREAATPRLALVVDKIVDACVKLEANTVWDLIGDKFAAPCIQGLISAIQKDAGKLQEIVSKIFPESAQDMHQAMTHFIACHTIEFALKYAPLTITKKLFETTLKGKLEEYALHQQATYIIQTFVSCIESRDVLLSILEELSGDKLAKIFDSNKGGVILCLVDKARQMGCNGVLQSVLDMLNSWVDSEGQSKALAPILITRNSGFTLGDVVGNQQKSLSYLGTTLLTYLLRFDESNRETLRPFIQSLSDLAKDKVITISKDKFGSRLFESFFRAKVVDETQKRKVYKKFKSSFAELSLSAPGSFVVETIFRWGEIKQKTEIMNELVQKINQLDQDKYGFKVSQNLDLKGFLEDKKAWEGRIKFKQALRIEFEQEENWANKHEYNQEDKYPPQKNQLEENYDKKMQTQTDQQEKIEAAQDGLVDEEIQPKIKKRKQTNENSMGINGGEKQVENPLLKQKKKKRQIEDDIGNGGGDESVSNPQKKQKKKKQKLKQSDEQEIGFENSVAVNKQQICENEELQCDQGEDEGVVKRKHKKNKKKKFSNLSEDLAQINDVETSEKQCKTLGSGNMEQYENSDGVAKKVKKEKKPKKQKQKYQQDKEFQEGLNIVQQIMGVS